MKRNVGQAVVIVTMALVNCPIVSIAAPPPLQLDNFNGLPVSRIVTGKPGTLPATGVLYKESGKRDVGLRITQNPANSVAVWVLNPDGLNVVQGPGVAAELTLAYGSFRRINGNPQVGGPPLGLNLSGYKSMVLDFAGAEDPLNIVVEFHTLSPSSPGRYYATLFANRAPSLNQRLLIPLPLNDGQFPWDRVAGIHVFINRSGGSPATSYRLNSIYFQP